ncbi:arylsulfatase [Flammeovirga pectinis]|uniref:Arylsulfatase n=1 Tax=Flammeovirga pectinis TaxID=2494373 RepID=A0A3S9P960_9BACT|nr:arylsulfatase [Flammeovirga pectinis]AZQ64748.1 arylsulfatase [Flammeovirga pectinis]
MKRLLLFSLLAFLVSCKTSKNETTKNEKISQPNIILIMADDMGFSDLGFMGSGINTPNIDRLANNGMVFNNFYNAGRCCPTRATLLTGLYAHNADLGWMTASDFGRPGYRGAISKNSVTIAQVLKSAGYANYITGKWHVTYDNNMTANADNSNWPLQRGFDDYYGILAGGGGYYDPNTLTKGNEIIAPSDNFYLTEAINTSTIDILDNHYATKKDQPYFFYVAHYAPHRPLHALKEDIKKYKGKFSKGWDHFRKQRYDVMKESGLADAWALSDRPKDIPAWDSLSDEEKAKWEVYMEVYAAQIDRMDQGIGQIVNYLEEKGELDNTIIMFLSDNGGNAEPQGKDIPFDKMTDIGGKTFNQSYRKNWANMSNTPFRLYKSSNHEGGISTPLIVHWPEKIKQAGITDQQGHVLDLMPTFMELAGAEYPKNVEGNYIKPYQGKSFVSALEGTTAARGPMYFEHQADRAIIDGNWKLVALKANKPPYKGKWKLYNLSKDRAEEHNLIDEHPEIAEKLKKQWDNWATDNNVLPLDGRGWNQRLKSDINAQKI